MIRHALLPALLLAAAALAPRPAAAAASYDQCTGFVDAPGTVITTPGVWCLRPDLALSGDGDHAIVIAADDVVLDCKGRALRLTGVQTVGRNGVRAEYRRGIVVRNCTFSGFRYGVFLLADQDVFHGNVVEDNVVTDGFHSGLRVEGDGSVVRRNRVARIATQFGQLGASGILTLYDVDIRDNVIEDIDVGSGARAFGILADEATGRVIEGNRIRGLVGGLDEGVIGIRVSGHANHVSGNDLVGDGLVGVAVQCWTYAVGEARVGDNVIAGFVEPMDADGYCADLGTNSVAP
jgi:hypothetical protein